jgi:hypothetical protein
MDEKDKIEPNGKAPYEHSFYQWGGTNPQWASQTKRLLQHRQEEQKQDNECTRESEQCPKL